MTPFDLPFSPRVCLDEVLGRWRRTRTGSFNRSQSVVGPTHVHHLWPRLGRHDSVRDTIDVPRFLIRVPFVHSPRRRVGVEVDNDSLRPKKKEGPFGGDRDVR